MKKIMLLLAVAAAVTACTKEKKQCGKVIRSYQCLSCTGQPKYITVFDFGDRIDSFYYPTQRDTGSIDCPGSMVMQPIR